VKISLKLFAAAKQLAGFDAIVLDLPPGATVGQLRRQLLLAAPSLAPMGSQLMFAVNADYADDSWPVPPDADVACIPPVSGG